MGEFWRTDVSYARRHAGRIYGQRDSLRQPTRGIRVLLQFRAHADRAAGQDVVDGRAFLPGAEIWVVTLLACEMRRRRGGGVVCARPCLAHPVRTRPVSSRTSSAMAR